MTTHTVRRIAGGRYYESEYHVFVGEQKAGVVYRGSRGWVYQLEGVGRRQWGYSGFDRMKDAAQELADVYERSR